MDTPTFVATIHFIGLALFSTQVPGEEGSLRVLLPRIEQHQRIAHHPDMSSSGGTAMQRIEPHVAAVIYREEDMLQEIGWQAEDVPEHMVAGIGEEKPLRYRMVRLDGERVTFMARGKNPTFAGEVDLRLPKPTCGARFMKNFDVAAMVAIPGGTLSPCVVRERSRYDTRLALDNSGVITVWGEPANTTRTRGATKAVVLRGNATVYVTNMPLAAMDHTVMTEGLDTAHYLAYYRLVRPTQRCMRELAEPTAQAALPTCPATPLRVTAPTFIRSLNSECSNSTWP